MRIFSFSPFGYEGSLVSVEVDLRRGIPAVDIVGLADGAVKESRERMRSAITNSGFEFPAERVLISLSPADLKKEGAGFDLAVAVAVLGAKENSRETNEDDSIWTAERPEDTGDSVLVMGELELNGNIRPVRAVHAAVCTACAGGIRKCIVPEANAEEAREVSGMRVFGAQTLSEAFCALNDSKAFTQKERSVSSNALAGIPEGSVNIEGVLFAPVSPELDFKEVRGQTKLIRALQIAAAGGHNILAYGPPGCGKTLCMQRFPSIIPLLTPDEAQSVTRIYSIAGLLPHNSPSVRTAPFRQPHQTATIEGMCGGGPKCTPGEISLAHNGGLFLDEAAEFRTSVLQMLRVPLETASITLSRAGRTSVFPADFQLLMSTNPCPCGNYGSTDKLCLCSARAVDQYWKKFSSPLLDRIELRVRADNNAGENTKGVSSEELRVQVARAVSAQRKRQGKRNSKLNASEIVKFCRCTDGAKKILNEAQEKLGFSPRAASLCMKVARTVADMSEKFCIDEECMQEAVDFRKAEGNALTDMGML